MVRQNTLPISVQHTNRMDTAARGTTGRAGKVVLIDYFPVLRGDAVGGQMAYTVDLNHMPKPLRNSVGANVQAWFVPHPALPRFQSYDEFVHSFQEEPITYQDPVTGLEVSRTPPPLFNVYENGDPEYDDIVGSDHFEALGIHIPAGMPIHDMIFDAYTAVYNFRLRALSNRLALRPALQVSTAIGTTFARAFWRENRFTRVVPDYERALVLGNLALDVLAGQLPISGIDISHTFGGMTTGGRKVQWAAAGDPNAISGTPAASELGVFRTVDDEVGFQGTSRVGAEDRMSLVKFAPDIFAEMGGSSVITTLEDVDRARRTQAMARYRSSLHGNTGDPYKNEDAVMAELMMGLAVPMEMWDRPVLIGQAYQRFAMSERPAMDGASLDQSTSRGRVSGRVPVNVPQQNVGGVVIITLEVLPERVYERQGDPFLHVGSARDLPDATRDINMPEPVEEVKAWQVDAAHTSPNATYGFVPRNDRWQRDFTRLGGDYYQTDANPSFSEVRSVFWLGEVQNPSYNSDHFLAPDDFPHYVFTDTDGPAFECTTSRQCVIRGLTQFGDALVEDNDDWEAVAMKVEA